MGMMGPPQKAKQFGASARRLVGLLAPQRRLIYVVVALALASVSLSVAGPKILGRATDLIFEGFFGARLPAGLSKAEAVAQIRASGNERTADLLDGMNVVPGRGIDFSALAQILALAMGLYVAASLLMWLQGHLLNRVVQHTIKRLRADVDAKLMRVPLAYFDRQQHGEVLSRVTNDIDNVAMGLQQTLSQVLIAALTALGILVMLVVISPLLALIVLVTVPLSVVATAKIGKRAQVAFVAQWKHVGQLNGQIEEAFTGHALVKVFGRRAAVEEKFRAKNGELFDAGYRAQFVSSLIMPAINFVGNLTYIAIAVVGGLRVSSGAMTLGGVQAFIQYSRQFSQNLSQLAQVANILQSGVASAERVFELLDEPDQSPEHDGALPRELRGEVRFENVSFRYNREAPLIEDLSLVASPGQTVAIVGPTGAGKSVLLALIALQFRRYPDSQVYIFDMGRSARAATLAMGGAHHGLGLGGDAGETIAFQPLRHIDQPDERAWAAEWIGALLAHEKVLVTPEVKEAVWSALTNLATAPVEERTLTGLSLLLQSMPLRSALAPYTLEGPFGRLLDAAEDDLRVADVQCFETEALMGSASVVAPVLTYLFHRLEERFTGRPTLLILDEAWKFLDHPLFAARIREWLKTLRKKNVAVLFASQSLADVADSGIAPAIIE
ncbi:MAG: ATP-binding cassette domain-containing protein, partial [Deltaproteobacteria bacterium]|nr:ATP-binding cassette domain-containing protein [Deltaproteobacteria bacterium]